MAFEVFEGRGRTASGTPTVSIRKNGALALNAAALDAWFKGQDYAVLMYDPDTKRIGVRPVAEKSKSAYKLQRVGQGGHVNAKSFLTHYTIDHAKSQSFPAEWDEQAKAVVAALR